MHCSRKRLLWRGLEFHVCTINKSAHTKKYRNLCNDPCIYIYIYIYIYMYSFWIVCLRQYIRVLVSIPESVSECLHLLVNNYILLILLCFFSFIKCHNICLVKIFQQLSFCEISLVRKCYFLCACKQFIYKEFFPSCFSFFPNEQTCTVSISLVTLPGVRIFISAFMFTRKIYKYHFILNYFGYLQNYPQQNRMLFLNSMLFFL